MIKKVPLLPNVVTAFGLSCGLFVIFKISSTPHNLITTPFLKGMIGILLLAVVADLLDGALARAMKMESEFGGFFDSLADGVSFGVGPSVFVLSTFTFEQGSEYPFFLMIAAMVYSICGVLRLVRFNIEKQDAKENPVLQLWQRNSFKGLPIPAGALAALSSALFSSLFQETVRIWIVTITLLLLGYLMISRWRFPSLKNLQLRIGSFQHVFGIVLATVLIFYGFLHHFAALLFLLTWGYIFFAFLLSVLGFFFGRRIKSLRAFDPRAEEDRLEEE